MGTAEVARVGIVEGIVVGAGPGEGREEGGRGEEGREA